MRAIVGLFVVALGLWFSASASAQMPHAYEWHVRAFADGSSADVPVVHDGRWRLVEPRLTGAWSCVVRWQLLEEEDDNGRVQIMETAEVSCISGRARAGTFVQMRISDNEERGQAVFTYGDTSSEEMTHGFVIVAVRRDLAQPERRAF